MQLRDACLAIKQRITTMDIAKRYGSGVSKKGWMKCPFHADSSPSLKVYDGDRGFYCYACHKGGDCITLASGLLGLSSVWDTVKLLNDEYHIGLDLTDRPLTAAERQAAKEAREKREQTRRAAQQVEQWRMAAVNMLLNDIQTANLLTGDPDTWTAEQKNALKWREKNEQLLDVLMGDDIHAILELYNIGTVKK